MEKSVQKDLTEDFEELIYLYSSYIENLQTFQKSLSKLKSFSSFDFLNDQTDFYLKSLKNSKKKLQELMKVAKTAEKKDFAFLNEQKQILWNLLRSQIGLIAALITSTDWQSPSFEYSTDSQSGIQEGKILAHINDYKRDRHLNEKEYEKNFVKEYVDGFLKIPVQSYLTSSGMGALTTIITFLKLENKVKNSLLIGSSIYFENKEMIKKFFSDKTIFETNEMDTQKILETIDREKLDVLLFDSLCNANTVAVPDLKTILKHVAKTAKKETYLVIDNSTKSIALQPLKEVVLNTHIRLIVFESLNKYHQFGMDRVTGGIIWLWGRGFSNFNYARVHAGTNITDSSCYVLPKPNRKMLKRRLERFNRNATFLSQSLLDYLKKHPSKKLDTIVYPGLKNHLSFSWSKDSFFNGSYFVVSFREKFQKQREYQKFVKMVMAQAKKDNVSIVGGTSFGFNETRIYLTAVESKFGIPFVRVSVGTENLEELKKLKDVFINVISKF